MEKWIYSADKADVLKLSKELNLPPLIVKILTNRNYLTSEEISDFLEEREGALNNPSYLPDVDLATDILFDAIANNKKVRIVGDYDADGIMSSSILYFSFKRLGLTPSIRLPDRFKDGYGLSVNIVNEAVSDNVDLIVTCDNGIAAYEAVEAAIDAGINVIVTDHHDVPFNHKNGMEIVPPADAIIDPKLSESAYPFRELCGAGVCYQWMRFALNEAGIQDKVLMRELLELCTVATVCDVVPLRDDNRKIVHQGLKNLNNPQNKGLKKLIDALDFGDKTIGGSTIGFRIGPCINAAGRMKSPDIALQLILGEEDGDNTSELIELNLERQSETEKGFRRAVNIIEEELKDDPFLICYVPDIHQGIVGNVAGKLKEKYNKPILVLTDSGDICKGSGRSTDAFDITSALIPYREFFEDLGGHSAACGVSIKKENIPRFREVFLKDENVKNIDSTEIKRADYRMPLDMIDMNVINTLSLLEPYGAGNEEPIFTELNVRVSRFFLLGKNSNVIKFIFLTEHNREVPGMLFHGVKEFLSRTEEKYGAEYLEGLKFGSVSPLPLDILFFPELNEFNGKKNIQISIKSWRFAK